MSSVSQHQDRFLAAYLRVNEQACGPPDGLGLETSGLWDSRQIGRSPVRAALCSTGGMFEALFTITTSKIGGVLCGFVGTWLYHLVFIGISD